MAIHNEKEHAIIVMTAEGTQRFELEPFSFEDGFIALINDVIAAVEGGSRPLCDLEQCYLPTETSLAIHESARTQRTVSLPLVTQFAPLEVLQHPVKHPLTGTRCLLYADAHFGSGGREGIAECLERLTGEATTVVDAEATGLTEALLQDVDILLIYHTQSESDPDTRALLESWVNAGKALCIVHAGLGAWPTWEAYQAWCGLVWDWETSIHPHAAAVLNPSPDTASAFGFSEAWLPRDEVFVKLKAVAPVTVHMTATLEGGDVYSAAWQPSTYGNVGIWMPGHRRDSWSVPAMQQGIGALLLRCKMNVEGAAAAEESISKS
jgi:hypothetical protein